MGHSFKENLLRLLPIISLVIAPNLGFSQYTDVINSNRPGLSVSAYAVGKSVVQAEFGAYYEQQDHSDLMSDSNIFGADLALRYGLLLENLEINWEGSFQNQDIKYTALGFEDSRTDFSRNRLGLKYLLYDPYKDPQRTKPNLYSWRADNKFQLRNLIPAVSVYAGANFILGDNAFFIEDPTVSPRVLVAAQSQLTPKSVLIINLIYDKIGTDYSELSYTISFSRAFRNPKWSAFIENQGIDSDRYSDILLRAGVSHLFNKNFQVDASLGGNFKTTPSRYFGSLGLSYRLDFHKDAPKAINSEPAGGPIRKNSMKKGKSNQLGKSKKESRKQRKKNKKRKKDIEDF
ncbi:MAG: transporter [Flavobacteriaceae bacterium]